MASTVPNVGSHLAPSSGLWNHSTRIRVVQKHYDDDGSPHQPIRQTTPSTAAPKRPRRAANPETLSPACYPELLYCTHHRLVQVIYALAMERPALNPIHTSDWIPTDTLSLVLRSHPHKKRSCLSGRPMQRGCIEYKVTKEENLVSSNNSKAPGPSGES